MGALLYELLIGLPPFYSRDPNEIYESVLSEELTFPDDVPLTS
jgi:serine/threonine protein kinase